MLQKLIEKNEVLFCVARFASRLLHRDKKFIKGIINWDKDPDKLSLVHLGNENDNSIVYIIKEQGQGYGFFAEFRCLLCELAYAESLGLKPTVYYGENYLYYEKNGMQGQMNAFEFYFEMKEKINNSFQSKNVIYSEPYHAEYISKLYNGVGYDSSEEFEERLAQVLRKYMGIKKELVENFEQSIYQLFHEKKVLGIHYRGTDFKQGYNAHPKEIKLEQIIKQIKEALSQGEFTYIFLATDEKGVFQRLQSEFGPIVKCYADVYRGNSSTSIAFSTSAREHHHYMLGLEVLRDAYTLSRCHGLIAGVSQVSFCARIMKKSREEKYDYLQIIDNGINSSKKEFKL